MNIQFQQAAHYAGVRNRLMRKPLKDWYTPTIEERLLWHFPMIWELTEIPAVTCTVKALALRIAHEHKLSFREFISHGRQVDLVRARHEFFYYAAKETTASLPMIGRRCGGRDHTTVLHGIFKYARDHNLPLPRGMKPSAHRLRQFKSKQAA